MAIKVLWICNAPTGDISAYANIQSYGSGWLNALLKALDAIKEVEVVYCFPDSEKDDKRYPVTLNGVKYYSFYASKTYGLKGVDAFWAERKKRNRIRSIMENEKPDIVHIFGTEYSHALIGAEEALGKYSVVCSTQGLTKYIAEHYLSYIPDSVKNKINFSCIVRGTLKNQERKLIKRGNREENTIRLCGNIIGRTEWDRMCTYYIFKERKYYFCNETLRDAFYEEVWKYEECVAHSIFVSQASSPLKGFNMVLKMLALLKDNFPDIKVNVAGNDFYHMKSLKTKMKESTYASYLNKYIKKHCLDQYLHFLGPLDEKGMADELKRCNVFLSASSIENSSNSIGEAMLMGVPVVSSFVGGIENFITSEGEGLLYQGDAYYMGANQIRRIFEDADFARILGERARKKAIKIFDREKNGRTLVEIYESILEKKSGNRLENSYDQYFDGNT